MNDRWTLYQRRPGLVLGFHVTEKKTDGVVVCNEANRKDTGRRL